MSACKLREDEHIIFMDCADDDDYLFMLTYDHKMVKVPVKDFAQSSRNTIGVKGAGNNVLSACIGKDEDRLVCLSRTETDIKYKCVLGSEYNNCAKGSSGFIVNENDVCIYNTNQLILVENGTKLSMVDLSKAALHGKTASGAKLCGLTLSALGY